MCFKALGITSFLVFSSFVFGLNPAKTDSNPAIKVDKKEEYDSFPKNAMVYLDEISKPYYKKPKVVKHVLGRKEEAFKLAEEKIDSLPKEERQKFAELLEIISRYCILDLSKSDLPEWTKKAIFMSFAKKYLSNFAMQGSHQESADGHFPGEKRYSEGWGAKTFEGYMQEDTNDNYAHARIDLSEREMLKMLSEEEIQKIKKANTEEFIKAGGDQYYIIHSDLIKLILNSKQSISDDLLNKYASTIPSMGKFIVLVNKFNAKLNNAKLNPKEKNSRNKNEDKIFALREKIKPIYREENKTVVVPSSIFAKVDKHFKYFGLQIPNNSDQKIRKELINKLRKNNQMKQNRDKVKYKKEEKAICNQKSEENQAEFEELDVSDEIAAEIIKQKIDLEKKNQSSVLTASFIKSFKGMSPIIGFSFILSLIYFFKKVILQFIKGIIKYSI